MSVFSFFSKSTTPATAQEAVASCPQLERASQVKESLEQKLRRMDEERKEQKERAAKAVRLKDKMIAARSAISLLDKEVKEAEKRLQFEAQVADNLETEVLREAEALDDFLDKFEESPPEQVEVQVLQPVLDLQDPESTLEAFKAFFDF